MIPKIIHQMGPDKKSNWHPIWEDCQKSWQEQFPEPYYQYIFWTDDTLRDLVKDHYPHFLNVYDNFPTEAFRIDFSRFCILHKYGGIYADLDFYCYKNFFKDLTDEIYLLESRSEWGEIAQNSLMASVPNHEFWINAMKLSVERFLNLPKEKIILKGHDYPLSFDDNEEFCNSIKYITGPYLLSDLYKEYSTSLFPNSYFHPFDHCSFFRQGDEVAMEKFKELKYKYTLKSPVKCRHFLSGIWGKEMIELSKHRLIGEK